MSRGRDRNCTHRLNVVLCNAGQKSVVVAIDGPAASGKGTLAKTLAGMLNLAHLDTGLLYRGVGWAAVSKGINLEDEAALEHLASNLQLAQLQTIPELRSDDAAKAASKVSVFPKVRAALLDAQRHFADNPPDPYTGE